jgi:pyruvate carboxylase
VDAIDRSVQPKAVARPKADLADLMQIGAPMPGLITSLAVSMGGKVCKGDKLLTLEAMKMQSTIYASVPGTVDSIYAQVGEAVESKDLLIKLRKK